MNRNNLLFPAIMNDLFKTDWLGGTEVYPSAQWPAVNIKETDKDFQLELAAPGLTKEDFKLSLDNHVLSIESVKKSKQER